MLVNQFPASDFPNTSGEILSRIGNTADPIPESVVLYGGGARNALLEATGNSYFPLRDIDLVPIGDDLDDDDFRTLHYKINPSDPDKKIRVFRYPSTDELLAGNVDFTINEAFMRLAGGLELSATDRAMDAVDSRIIVPTAGRIRLTKSLQAAGESMHKRFLKNETDMPARAAGFVAVFATAGSEYNYDLLDHPRPEKPFDTLAPRDLERRAHPFFLGLAVDKVLSIDEAERQPDDITATKVLLEIYKEMGLIEANTPSETIEDVVAFLQACNEAKPAFKPSGSKVAQRVKFTDRLPEPKAY